MATVEILGAECRAGRGERRCAGLHGAGRLGDRRCHQHRSQRAGRGKRRALAGPGGGPAPAVAAGSRARAIQRDPAAAPAQRYPGRLPRPERPRLARPRRHAGGLPEPAADSRRRNRTAQHRRQPDSRRRRRRPGTQLRRFGPVRTGPAIPGAFLPDARGTSAVGSRRTVQGQPPARAAEPPADEQARGLLGAGHQRPLARPGAARDLAARRVAFLRADDRRLRPAGRAFPPLYRRTVAAAPRGRRSERHARRVARDRTGRRPGPGFPAFQDPRRRQRAVGSDRG